MESEIKQESRQESQLGIHDQGSQIGKLFSRLGNDGVGFW